MSLVRGVLGDTWRQLEINASIVILFGRRTQVQLSQGHLAAMSRRQIIERVSHDGIVRNIEPLTVFEHQCCLRLIFSWSWRSIRWRISLGSSSATCALRIAVSTYDRGSRTASIKDCRSASVIFLIRRVVETRIDRHRIRYRVDGAPHWTKIVAAVITPRSHPVGVRRKQRINAAVGKSWSTVKPICPKRRYAWPDSGCGTRVSTEAYLCH